MDYKVAVVGATGNVGREMLDILAERNFPAHEVVAVASRRSHGVECSFGDKTLKVKAIDHFDFSDVDICLMSAGGAVSKEWSPKIAAQGTVVIDNSSAWRMDPDVPLIVPEVNADAVSGFTRKNIIANPNCSTAQLVVALKPLHDKARIKRVVVATYQSVSGAGKEAMDELFSQSKAVFTLDEVEAKKFSKRIAFNVIPHIDIFVEARPSAGRRKRTAHWPSKAGPYEHSGIIVPGDSDEFSSRRIAHRKLAGCDAEVRAMHHDLSAFDQAAQAGKGHQVIKAVDDVRLLEPSQVI